MLPEKEQPAKGSPTLGVLKPGEMLGFDIEPEEEPGWTATELEKLSQHTTQGFMFGSAPARRLEKIPFKFYHRFRCPHADCAGHRLSCTDWELGASYRSWRQAYGAGGWQAPFRTKYETEMMQLNDSRIGGFQSESGGSQLPLDEVVGRVTEELAATPGLIAVLLVGSTARGDRHPLSDIDFLVLIDDGIPWPLKLRDGGRRAWLDESGYEVEVGYTTIRRVRALALQEAETGLPHRLCLFLDGQLLAGGGPEYGALVAEMLARYEAGPPSLSAQDRRWEGFDTWCRLRRVDGIAAESPAAAELLMFEVLEHLIRLCFRLRSAWQPRTERLLEGVAELDAELASLAHQFLAATGADGRTAALHAMASHLQRTDGLELTGNYVSGSGRNRLNE